MPTTTQTRQAGRQVKLRERQSMAYLILFLFWQRSGGFSTHRASEQERAAIVIVWEICSLFVRAPLHAADTKISHVIGFARRGGTECSSLCI